MTREKGFTAPQELRDFVTRERKTGRSYVAICAEARDRFPDLKFDLWQIRGIGYRELGGTKVYKDGRVGQGQRRHQPDLLGQVGQAEPVAPLTSAQIGQIVTQLKAQGLSPSAIAARLLEDYRVVATPDQVNKWRPAKAKPEHAMKIEASLTSEGGFVDIHLRVPMGQAEQALGVLLRRGVK